MTGSSHYSTTNDFTISCWIITTKRRATSLPTR